MATGNPSTPWPGSIIAVHKTTLNYLNGRTWWSVFISFLWDSEERRPSLVILSQGTTWMPGQGTYVSVLGTATFNLWRGQRRTSMESCSVFDFFIWLERSDTSWSSSLLDQINRKLHGHMHRGRLRSIKRASMCCYDILLLDARHRFDPCQTTCSCSSTIPSWSRWFYQNNVKKHNFTLYTVVWFTLTWVCCIMLEVYRTGYQPKSSQTIKSYQISKHITW